jgi:1-acyl-sn-glycerol-3-phosphate acyltransferase
VATGRALVPIAIRGTRDVMRPGARVLRRGPIDVAIHPPIAPTGTGRAEIARLRDAVRSAIERSLADRAADPVVHSS